MPRLRPCLLPAPPDARRGSTRGWLLLGLVALLLAAMLHLRVNIFLLQARFLVLAVLIVAAAVWLLRRRRP